MALATSTAAHIELAWAPQPVSERALRDWVLRDRVLKTLDWDEQRRRWEGLKATFA